MSRTTSSLAPSRSMMAGMHAAEVPIALSLESAESESLQKLLANIRGQIGFWVCRRHVRNRPADACVYRSCQKGMDVARMRSAEHNCHAGDLSALVNLVRHGCEEVGTCRKQRIKVGHHAILPDEAMRPIEAGVQSASYHLAPVVDAGAYGGKISRQSTKVCEYAVLPNRGKLGCVVSAANYSSNLAVVVNGFGDGASSEVRKRGGIAVFPQYAVNCTGADSREAYGLALIVDRHREPVWIATHRRKRLDFAVFP